MNVVLSPRDEAVIVAQAHAMNQRLEANVFTSPLKAALVGGIGGAAFAFATKRDVARTAATVAAVSAVLASSHRFWYSAGWACGFCSGMGEGKEI
jgi:tetrahydromethanopterin S-methyltransferase subunit D